jgi:hypothetical protein
VAIVGVGPDDRWEDRDQDRTRTEDVGLPEHERDEVQRRAGETGDRRPDAVAAVTDTGLDEAGVPEHEDDSRRAGDTGTSELNP